jgi:hypothetical protein
MALDRKEFLRTALSMVGLGFVASRIASCGGSDGPPSGTGTAGTGSSGGSACDDPVENIAGNHGHVLTVSPADVAAGASRTYSIQGTSTHNHMVTISAANFAKLAAGEVISLTSTTGAAHEHGVTVSCA